MEKNKSGIYPAIPEAVVVGNGEFPSHPFPLSVLDQAPCVVCCDGGANALVESGRLPDWIVGDGDSLSEENRIRFQDRIHRIPDQETNDQTKAVSFLASQAPLLQHFSVLHCADFCSPCNSVHSFIFRSRHQITADFIII